MTAALMNTHLRDNITELRAGGLAISSLASGDIPVASGASQLARDAALAFDTSIDELKSGRFRAVDDAPSDYLAGMLKAISGFRLHVTALEGSAKLSQNRPAQDREGVRAGLAASSAVSDQAIAALMDRTDR